MKDKQVSEMMEMVRRVGAALPADTMILWSAGVKGATVIAVAKRPTKSKKK